MSAHMVNLESQDEVGGAFTLQLTAAVSFETCRFPRIRQAEEERQPLPDMIPTQLGNSGWIKVCSWNPQTTGSSHSGNE